MLRDSLQGTGFCDCGEGLSKSRINMEGHQEGEAGALGHILSTGKISSPLGKPQLCFKTFKLMASGSPNYLG